MSFRDLILRGKPTALGNRGILDSSLHYISLRMTKRLKILIK